MKDYYEIISNPVDLQTIESRLKSYKNFDEFEEDIMLIFSNCKTYNSKNTVYWGHADTLEKFIKPHLNKIKQRSQIQNEMRD